MRPSSHHEDLPLPTADEAVFAARCLDLPVVFLCAFARYVYPIAWGDGGGFQCLIVGGHSCQIPEKIHISRFLLLDAVYVGAFIALDAFISGWALSLAACVLASMVYLASNRLLTGLGGRLGMQAFISCVILLGVHTCLQWQ